MDSRDSFSQNPIFNNSCSPINLEDDNVVEVCKVINNLCNIKFEFYVKISWYNYEFIILFNS